MANLDSKGLLADEGKAKTSPELGDFAQTPKYIDDSSNTDRMARFFIADNFRDALLNFYKTDSNAIISALENKGFFDFFITSISDSSQDRYQLTETMGENFVLYGFNKAPEIITCSGVLKNTLQDDWKVQFLEFFKKIGGISSLAKFYKYNKKDVANFISFKYDSVIKRGALLNVSHSLSAANEMDIPFSFSFIVTKTINFTQINGSSIKLNTGTEADIINNKISTVRTITKAGLRTLEPSDTPNNPATNTLVAQNVKQSAVNENIFDIRIASSI